MKIASWNVNSLKVRLPQLLEWLAMQRPDIVCLQETKLEDHNFPLAEIESAGYQAVFSGQKTYNGVALVSRKKLSDVIFGNPYFPDPQKRLISGCVDGKRIICAYVPNGQALGSDKFEYKLAWLAALVAWLKHLLATNPKLILAGDFNIAPEGCDVHNPAAWIDQILCSEPERECFRRVLGLGLKDSFRLFEQPEKSFTWWDYRMLGFRRNLGLRIDHILLSNSLVDQCFNSGIDREMRKRERPSDHAPIYAELHDR